MTHRYLAIALLLAAGCAGAQWRVVTEHAPGAAATTPVAVVENDSGHSLRIFRDADGAVQGLFTIRNGFDVLAPGGCPSYSVDHNPPAPMRFHNDGCSLEARHAQFSFGRPGAQRLSSTALRQLMDGSALLVRYHVQAHGYRETRFSLARSRQALSEVIGPEIVVEED